MNTKSNGHARDLVSWYDVPANIRGDWFDYVTDEEERYGARFFQYRGSWYDVNDGFVPATNAPSGVEAWQPESYFGAVGIRFTNDYQSVIVTYCHW